MAHTFSLKRQSDSQVIAASVKRADSFLDRALGLIPRTSMSKHEGLWFPKCSSVHMWFMRIPIDILFLKKTGSAYQVTSVYREIHPWKFLPCSDLSATDTIELAAGAIGDSGLREGDELCLS